MATADDVTNELMGTNPPAGHHATVVGEGGPAPYTAYSLQDKVSHAVREVTLWLPRRALSVLTGKRGGVDTTLGHAIDAASYGDINYRVLAKIAASLKVDISDIQ